MPRPLDCSIVCECNWNMQTGPSGYWLQQETPRCFRDNPPSIPYYFHQASAWNDRVLYVRWWEELGVPEKDIREWTSDPVALIIDGFKGHDRSVQIL